MSNPHQYIVLSLVTVAGNLSTFETFLAKSCIVSVILSAQHERIWLTDGCVNSFVGLIYHQRHTSDYDSSCHNTIAGEEALCIRPFAYGQLTYQGIGQYRYAVSSAISETLLYQSCSMP